MTNNFLNHPFYYPNFQNLWIRFWFTLGFTSLNNMSLWISFSGLFMIFYISMSCFRDYASKIPRRFNVRYDPYTKRINVISGRKGVCAFLKDLQGKSKLYLILACTVCLEWPIVDIELIVFTKIRQEMIRVCQNPSNSL